MKEIILTNGSIVQVDDEDFESLSYFNWYESSNGYAFTTAIGREGLRKGVRRQRPKKPMHQVISGLKSPDHIDGNRLNNQKHNLRPATTAQQAWNRSANRKHGHWKGVYLMASGKWRARIQSRIAGMRSLGCYWEACDAALAYNLAAEELYGEFARYNLPLEVSQ